VNGRFPDLAKESIGPVSHGNLQLDDVGSVCVWIVEADHSIPKVAWIFTVPRGNDWISLPLLPDTEDRSHCIKSIHIVILFEMLCEPLGAHSTVCLLFVQISKEI
jgi:hypothetical protein